jgi:hypothetical protein
MEQLQKPATRKKFLLWGTVIVSSLTLLKFFSGKKKKDESDKATVKMLTQDGKLVEIDKKFLTSSGNRISNEELQKWIKK